MLGFLPSGEASGKKWNTPNLGRPGPWGAAPSSAGEGAGTGLWDQGDTPGVTHPFQHLDETQGLLETAPAQPTKDTVLQERVVGGREHRDSAGTCPGVHSGEPGGLHRGSGGLPGGRGSCTVSYPGLPQRDCSDPGIATGDQGAAKGPAPSWGLSRWGEVCPGKPGALPRGTGGAAPRDREAPPR